MDFLPIFFDIKNKSCLVVGGGEIASRKVRFLQQAGGLVHVVAPQLHETLVAQLQQNKISHKAENFIEQDLDGHVLVIAATDDEAINQQVSEAAKKRNLPVNVVDAPQLCSFIVPSIIDRSPVVVAVSSGGSSPVLARLIKAKLETIIPASYGRLANLVKSYREKVKAAFS
ncbi:MAG: bifunctional precorrin-2 dehydrogenase/sirohydrochlorin ferrochelatase, partial [Gammaproteobacteria bacterium]|nr:bifunctional precorrin-2 dehydrogenase/sirohydrochlorin ferrochelatase [Gammaproteobacteria bacterium]